MLLIGNSIGAHASVHSVLELVSLALQLVTFQVFTSCVDMFEVINPNNQFLFFLGLESISDTRKNKDKERNKERQRWKHH